MLPVLATTEAINYLGTSQLLNYGDNCSWMGLCPFLKLAFLAYVELVSLVDNSSIRLSLVSMKILIVISKDECNALMLTVKTVDTLAIFYSPWQLSILESVL